MSSCRNAAAAGAVLGTVGLTFAARIWMREREAKTVFPAADAGALLNPLRRIIQSPSRTVAALGVARGERVLEVGLGPGYFTGEVATAVGEGGMLVSADLQPPMLRALRDHLGPARMAHVRLAAADATRLPFRDGAFDRVCLVAVLGEVPYPEAALAEFRRVLRRGGVAAFCEMLTDPDYVREGTLRAMCWRVGLEFEGRERNPIGYTARFRRSV